MRRKRRVFGNNRESAAGRHRGALDSPRGKCDFSGNGRADGRGCVHSGQSAKRGNGEGVHGDAGALRGRGESARRERAGEPVRREFLPRFVQHHAEKPGRGDEEDGEHAAGGSAAVRGADRGEAARVLLHGHAGERHRECDRAGGRRVQCDHVFHGERVDHELPLRSDILLSLAPAVLARNPRVKAP